MKQHMLSSLYQITWLEELQMQAGSVRYAELVIQAPPLAESNVLF